MTASTDDSVSAPAVSLSFNATVDRTLVHRASVAEVFVTDSVEVPGSAAQGDGPRAYDVAAQLPRGHLVGEHPSAYDFLLLVEVLRQTGVVIAHRHMDVPLSSAFIFSALRYELLDLEAIRIGDRPAHAVTHVTARPETNRAGRVLGFEFGGVLDLDGVPTLRASGGLTFVGSRAYRMLRASGLERARTAAVPRTHRPAPASPGAVGRRDVRNVVVTEPVVESGGEARAFLVVDTKHPHLFDHALDHVPGNLQLEAARQLAVAAVARSHGLSSQELLITSVRGRFTEFAELGLATRVTARVGGVRHAEELGTLTVPVEVRLSQDDTTVSEITLEVAQWL
ncbi:ScbA/BarX family gamma-butyrolactone biosynthesis protein [Streptomyces echinoruber]|uniref:ScbA/BarX family gamma-butyrolactone biosynthesis protein n=1 Tax=Streptomyces echinoruber TaxID=68898 RepID=UPI00167D718A|nr:ScbA/BarX family gamma-butyrolactone biosynthesis protein [Streptomyces echinoruber]